MPSKAEEKVDVFLLGSFALKVADRLVHLPTRKMEALLAYLVLHPGIQSRERIASLFWGDSPEERARRSLRTALAALRKEVGENLIIADRETIQLHPQVPIWVDVREMEKQAIEVMAADGHPLSGMDLDLYRADLLQDFYEDWVLEEREHYRNLFVRALSPLAQSLKTHGEYQRAISVAQKIISVDPGNEQAYGHLIFSYGALGQRSEALKAYEECARRLMEQFGVEPSEEMMALMEQVKKPETSAPPGIRSNLPIPLTSFVGREQELKTLGELFTKTRLLTLTGVGGCGKTRLAIAFAGQIGDSVRDGVWWIDLASLQEETQVTQAIKRTLGLSDSQVDSAEESLIKFLHPKQILFVLDNCEHVIQAAARFAGDVLSQCPFVKIIATSREALSIPGEIAWLVPSLSLPPAEQTVNLLNWECPRLFFERATSYRPDLQLTESNAGSLLRICRALEGIPLAIELAAARVKTLSLEQLASRLDDKLGLLTTGSRVAQPRQQTLRAAVDWSYELLSAHEQIVLQRLSVLYGSWTLEAAENLCAEEPIGSGQILDLITHLLDKSLIVSENREGALRYRMLEIIRQYAMEKLQLAGDVQRVSDRHTRYYSEMAQSVGNAWYSTEQSALLKQFDADYPNLRAALTWGLEHPGRRENWKFGLKLALALVPYWNFQAELTEGRHWLKKVVDQIDAVLKESDLEPVKRDELLSIQAKAIYETGALSYYLTQHAATMDLFERAASIYRELGDETGLAYPNLYLAQAASDAGQIDLARVLWTQSLNQFEQIGDRWYAAMVHSFFGALERRLGNYQESEREFHQAIELYSALGDQWGQSIMFSHLGVVALKKGEAEQARSWFEQRRSIAQRVGFKFSLAYSTFLIGLTYWKSGDYASMEKCFLEAMPHFYEIGNYGSLADCLVGIAWVAAQAGQLEQAAYLLGKVEELNETFGRKVYFEYEYFNQPLCAELRTRLSAEYQPIIEKGRKANIDGIVKDLMRG